MHGAPNIHLPHRMIHPPPYYRLLLLSTALAIPQQAAALEHLVALRDGEPQELAGKALVEAGDGGLLLATNDGAMLTLPAESIRSRKSDNEKLVMLDADALGKQLLAEMPPGFQIYHSTHYVVCYNTTRPYAKWCSSLLERLQRAFVGFWKRRGCDVHVPEHPLVVIVFGDRGSYAHYAQKELGAAAGSVIGFYSIESNRIAMYDLTGEQSLRKRGGQRGSLHDISALLSQPAALPLVATIVHEATHQISFNSGLQVRFADNPVWLSEGLAMYFETPDLGSSSGWRGIGNVNYPRLDLYRQNVALGKATRFRSLIVDAKRLKTPRTAVDAYAESWAWTYFLIRWRPKQYAAYLKSQSEKPLLVQDDPATRLDNFLQHFGEDAQALEAEFFKRMSRVK